jgi:hypothetical protein
MEWTVSLLSDQRIVVIQTQGVADETSSLEMAKSLSQIMILYKSTRLLIDHSALHSVSGDTFKVYYRPQEFHEIGVPFKVRLAEVVLPAHKDHFGFLETVCRNRGFNFSIFDDRESAIQWLME